MSIKFANIAKIGAIVVVGGILVLNTKSCIEGQIELAERKKRALEGNNNPTTSSDVMTQPTTLDYSENSFVNNYSENNYANDYSEYVNDDIYYTLLSAKDKYESLLNNGDSVSEKMINNGVKLNVNNSGFIDHGVKGIYQLICDYVSAYEKRDYDTCYSSGKQLSEFTHNLSKPFMYSLLVSDKLDSEYQSQIKCDEFGNFVYQSGNITLENGRQIRIIGGKDPLFGENNLSDVNSRMKWIETIPSIIFNKYSQVKNNTNDGVCYIINETMAEDCCYEEFDALLTEGASEYSFDKTDATILSKNDEYVFAKGYDVYGLLDYNQKTRYERMSVVKNALSTHQADVLYLDSCASDLYNKQTNNGYNK